MKNLLLKFKNHNICVLNVFIPSRTSETLVFDRFFDSIKKYVKNENLLEHYEGFERISEKKCEKLPKTKTTFVCFSDIIKEVDHDFSGKSKEITPENRTWEHWGWLARASYHSPTFAEAIKNDTFLELQLQKGYEVMKEYFIHYDSLVQKCKNHK
jgi:hypothetical protein